MNNQPLVPPEPTDDEWEKIVRETVRHFPYPVTPDIAAGLRLKRRSRRINPIWRVAAALVLILLILTLAVPQVRAVVLEFIQVGAVRIFAVEPTATPLPHTPTVRPPTFAPGASTPLASALDMPGETTLDEARAQSGFEFGLPTLPEDLGAPDQVFLQQHDAYLITLVWIWHDQPEQVRLVMEILNDRLIATKIAPMNGSEYVRVNGHADSLWMPNPHQVNYYFERDNAVLERLVHGNVLIWKDGDLTLRLETDLPLQEAIRIAESLR